MNKYAIGLLCASALLMVALSSAGSRTTTSEACSEPAPTPTPYVVPGTELKRNVATTKPGYEFIKREGGVNVTSTRTGAFMGSYTCPCRSTDPNRKCDLVFSPTYITCKGGSCGASTACLIVGAPLMKRQ